MSLNITTEDAQLQFEAAKAQTVTIKVFSNDFFSGKKGVLATFKLTGNNAMKIREEADREVVKRMKEDGEYHYTINGKEGRPVTIIDGKGQHGSTGETIK